MDDSLATIQWLPDWGNALKKTELVYVVLYAERNEDVTLCERLIRMKHFYSIVASILLLSFLITIFILTIGLTVP